MELASCQNYDALNFKMAPTFLENVCTQAQKVDCPKASQEIPRILCDTEVPNVFTANQHWSIF
jgi:hypothetical protein